MRHRHFSSQLNNLWSSTNVIYPELVELEVPLGVCLAFHASVNADAGNLLNDGAKLHREKKENKKKEKDAQAGKQVADGEPDALLICDKQRNGEWEGQIGLWFDKNSQQFLGNPGDEPLSLYVHPEEN